jgi:hypothetical protein
LNFSTHQSCNHSTKDGAQKKNSKLQRKQKAAAGPSLEMDDPDVKRPTTPVAMTLEAPLPSFKK